MTQQLNDKDIMIRLVIDLHRNGSTSTSTQYHTTVPNNLLWALVKGLLATCNDSMKEGMYLQPGVETTTPKPLQG